MKPLKKKIILLSILAILALISIPFLLNHYLSFSSTNKLFQRVTRSKAETDFTERSEILKNKLVLIKGKPLIINNNKIIFKGVGNKTINLSLYLLELDPEYAYNKKISTAEAVKGFRLGNDRYELISVNKKVLKIKKAETIL